MLLSSDSYTKVQELKLIRIILVIFLLRFDRAEIILQDD